MRDKGGEMWHDTSPFPTYLLTLRFNYNNIIMKYHYNTCGTCARAIDIEINDGVITSVAFTGGCNGNTQGLSAMVAGLKPEFVIGRLKGIQCGAKGTSCPDQLARALEEIEAEKA